MTSLNQMNNKHLEIVGHVFVIGIAVIVSLLYWRVVELDWFKSETHLNVDSSTALSSWQPRKQRIFLFISPTCPFCRRSMGFYARLGDTIDSLQRAGEPVTLAAVIDRPAFLQTQRRMLRDLDVPVDTLLVLRHRSLNAVGVTGVPTVAVETPTRSRPATWVGLQDSTGEQEILTTVRRLGKTETQFAD